MKKKKRTTQESLLEALALGYRPRETNAPKVVAKGRGLVAEKIIDLARKAGVPVKEDPALFSLLSHLNVDQEIPPEAYKVVAELLAFIYKIHHRWKEEREHESHGRENSVGGQGLSP